MQSHVFSLVSVGLCVLGQHFLKWGVVSVAYNSSYTVVYILPYTLSISVPFKYNLISQSVGTLPNNINLVFTFIECQLIPIKPFTLWHGTFYIGLTRWVCYCKVRGSLTDSEIFECDACVLGQTRRFQNINMC